MKEVEQNPLPKSQTKPFYIGTKEAPSDILTTCRRGQFTTNVNFDEFIEKEIFT